MRISCFRIREKEAEYSFFVDSYAFLVHGIGPAVGGQAFILDPDVTKCSSGVLIEKNEIQNIKCWNKEVPGE